MSAWRSRLHGEQFIFSVLKSKDERRLATCSLIVSVGGSVAGLVTGTFDWTVGGLIVSGLGLTLFLFKLHLAQRSISSVELKVNPEFWKRIAQARPCEALVENGFEIVVSPVMHKKWQEPILRSRQLDRVLRQRPLALRMEAVNPRFMARLQAHAGTLEKVIRSRIAQAAQRDQMFLNEPKLALLSDPLLHSREISVTRGSYFESFVSNDWTALRLMTRAARPVEQASGLGWMPSLSEEAAIEILPIDKSLLGNHLGVSTLAVTRDRQIILWRQSDRAAQSQGMLVPSGSGSVDWQDYAASPRPGTLVHLARRAMERELAEESRTRAATIQQEDIVGTLVLGYFRWLRRGGKPECVGITRLSLDLRELEPDGREVDMPDDLDREAFNVLQAENASGLRESIRKLLTQRMDLVSLPLWVSLTVLDEALADGDAEVQRLLFGSGD